jgi:hypothetical protein
VEKEKVKGETVEKRGRGRVGVRYTIGRKEQKGG